jgi:hypothetical protein
MTPLATRASLRNRWWNGLHSSASVRGEQSRRGSIAVSRGRALLPTAMNLQTCGRTLQEASSDDDATVLPVSVPMTPRTRWRPSAPPDQILRAERTVNGVTEVALVA